MSIPLPSNSSMHPPAINFATEWLDEHGRVCPKYVDYATQCPKGHSLVPLVADGVSQAQQPIIDDIICRVCHISTQRQHACGWLACSVAGCCGGYAVCAACVTVLGSEHKAAAVGIDDFCMMGISLEYLRWLKTEFGEAWQSHVTTSQFEKMYLRPRSSRLRCSVIDALAADAATAKYVGPATWFISHVWSNPFSHTLDAILIFFEGRADAADAMLWFDVFVDSQHAADGPSKTPQWYMSTFKSSIAHIGRMLLVVDTWNNPTPLKRAWCVLELHAIAMKKAEGGGDFAVAMTALEKQRFLDGACQDFGSYFNMLGSVDLEMSDCSRSEDRESIHAGIRDSVGFGELGRMVFGVMEVWMVEELRAQVATKRIEEDKGGEMQWSCILGNSLFMQGRHDEALEFEENALSVGRSVLSEGDERLGVYMNNLANTYGALGRHKDALAMAESALEFRRRVLPPDHPFIGDSMSNLSNRYSDVGRHEDALAMQESALEFQRRVLPPNHPDIGTRMLSLAGNYSNLGRLEDALAMNQSALESLRKALPPNHPDIGSAMHSLAVSYSNIGRHEDALAMNQSALDLKRRVLPPDHTDIGDCMNALAVEFIFLGRYDDALLMLQNVLDFRRRILPSNHSHIGDTMTNLAATYSNIGRHEDALAMAESALEFRRRVLPPDHPDIGKALGNLANRYSDVGRHEDALAMQESALEFQRRVLPPNHPDIGTRMLSLAGNYSNLGRLEDALAMNQSALESLRKALPPNHPDIGSAMHSLAVSYSNIGRHEDALAMNQSALECLRKALPSNHPHIGASMCSLAETYVFLGRYQDALAMNQSALELKRQVLSPNHPDIGKVLFCMSSIYLHAGNMLLAMEMAQDALAVFQAVQPPSQEYVTGTEERIRYIQYISGSIHLQSEHSAAHASAAIRIRNAGNVTITRHRGGGFADADYMLQFQGFNTFVADVKLSCGSFYFEMQVIEIVCGAVQFGCCSDGFEPREDPGGQGAGDDELSWGVCGLRQEKWHAGKNCTFGSKWCVGDVVGFALDARTAGNYALSVSVNGSFVSPNGLAFSGIDASFMSPAFSGDGRYRVNFGDRPFAHAPPGPEFMSVHAFRQSERDDLL